MAKVTPPRPCPAPRLRLRLLGLEAVRGSTLAHNDRMQRVFEKNGFEQTGDGSILSRYDNRRYTELFYERRRGRASARIIPSRR